MAEQTKPCPNCGQETRVGATFCTKCGTRFEDAPHTRVSGGGEQAEPEGQGPPSGEPTAPETAVPPSTPSPAETSVPPSGPGATPETSVPPAGQAPDATATPSQPDGGGAHPGGAYTEPPADVTPPPGPQAPLQRQTGRLIVLTVVVLAVIGGVALFALTRGEDGEFAALETPETQAQETAEPGPTAEPTEAPLVAGPSGYNSRINDIEVDGSTYVVHFETAGFQPMLGGENKHLHFFFDTVPPSQAGVPGGGPWKIHPTQNGVVGQSPFTDYGVGDVPQGASALCILVANSDHSVIQDTGNCVPLP